MALCAASGVKADSVSEAISIEVCCPATTGEPTKISCLRRGSPNRCCLRRGVAAVGVCQDYIQSARVDVVEIRAAVAVEVGSAHL